MHKAVRVDDNNLPIIKLLIANKADVTAKNKRSKSVLDVSTGVEVKKVLEEVKR